MILVDMGAFQMKVLYGKDMNPSTIDPKHLKHLMLFKLADYQKKFRKYGKMMLCYDNSLGGYWRKDSFEYYKSGRKKNREAQDIDWKTFFDTCNELQKDIENHLSYGVININKMEADDIIGVGAKYFHLYEKIMILSTDGDLKQLQQYDGVEQYNINQNKLIVDKDPIKNLKEKIIRGDTGDGIPNILSEDNNLVNPLARQPSIFTKKVVKWLDQEPKEFCDGLMMERFERNKKLIDLDEIPENYVTEIKKALAEQLNIVKQNNPMKYLMKNRFKNLLEKVNYL